MAVRIDLPSILLLLFWNAFITSQSFDFVYQGFNGTDNLVLEGATVIKPSGALRLTNKSHDVIGHAFYSNPIPIFNTSTSFSSSFSTYLVFQIVPAGDNKGGYGLAFTLSPSPRFLGGQGGHFLGVLNTSNDGKAENQIFMVEFDTVRGFDENSDTDGNHVGINVNTMKSIASEPASYYIKKTNAKEEVNLESGEPIQAWIDYDGLNKIVNVTISTLSVSKPERPLMSEKVDLSLVMNNKSIYAGFSAATGKKRSSHYILGWSFRLNGIADSLDLPRLPIPPSEKKSSSMNPHVKLALISSFSVLVFFLLVALISFHFYRRMTHYEVLEEWELDCPHRFRYKDLFAATKGFKDSELLGVGGFGAVYKGVLLGSGAEVAVKKISNNSMQGMREFAAEIESLGRLRHKNLVNLQGWCKCKNDLLLVYDYVPNGSLHSLLYSSPKNGTVLTWEQRFNIIKGIAAGLQYLHEEWEQVVIHRDVKSSNVLIDGDMNARLGDFGLARLYDHGKNSYTTTVVGTIGYIAPELSRTGQASTSTDVYAYGVLLLEVACGRPPIVHDPAQGHVILADWVMEYVQSGGVLDAADPELNSIYLVEEIELVLKLGLLCSHPRVEARPTMRQVMRYLNADDLLPAFGDKLSSGDYRRTEESSSGFLNVISTDTIPRSYHSSAVGDISNSSFKSGR
ncbi:hypothetical protein ACH5RR_005018 [Cinchona calisaya]|uniref:non-specific serine/threonine protein kinase n=1 Tax=Cinchona calisaya TaxID=153742 RepID=A0ABD3AZ64_9GENT